jgi:inosine-uridine nucleoside N-ribohydrolase
MEPPDGWPTHTLPAVQDAVDFIIETIHRYPHEVTILEIAPPTNLALAIRKDPTIVPLIKKLVTMAGQIYAPGNAYLDNAEFNWWFDPEATQIVLRADIPHFIIPLDCTNTIPLTKTFSIRSLSTSRKPSSLSSLKRPMPIFSGPSRHRTPLTSMTRPPSPTWFIRSSPLTSEIFGWISTPRSM